MGKWSDDEREAQRLAAVRVRLAHALPMVFTQFEDGFADYLSHQEAPEKCARCSLGVLFDRWIAFKCGKQIQRGLTEDEAVRWAALGVLP